MIYVDKIKMKNGCKYSYNQVEIDELLLSGSLTNPGWFKKEIIHDFIKNDGGVVKVNIAPYPNLIPAISSNGEKYVKSVADETYKDNLMSLPRE